MIRRLRDALTVYADRRLTYIFFMGFASGLPLLLTASTLQIWMTEVGVSLTAIGFFALVGAPYSLKFVWAPFLDHVRVPFLSTLMGQRRSWMMVIQLGLIGAICGLGFSDPLNEPGFTALLALAVAFFSASQDVVIDAYRIEILDPDQQGAGAAMTQAGYRLGLILAGAGALYLADYLKSWSAVFVAMSVLMIAGVAATLLAPLPIDTKPQGRDHPVTLSLLSSTLTEPYREFFHRYSLNSAIVILAFVLLYKLGDAFAGAMANPFYIKMGFSKIEIANVTKVFGVVASLVGIVIGGMLVKRYGTLNSLLGCGILQMLSNLLFSAQASIGYDIQFLYLLIGVENLTGGMASSAFVAYLSLLCHSAHAGTQFAMLTSFMAFGRTWLSTTSGWVADKLDWVMFFFVSTVVALPGLVLLVWMMKSLPMARQLPDQGG